MKKIYLLLMVLFLFSACMGKKEFNIDKVEAPKDYTLFKNINDNLDVKNAGLSTYNYELELAFLLDISNEADYEKYFYKSYINEISFNINDSEISNMVMEFLNNGSSITEAYKYISYMYENKRSLLETANFFQYCFPDYNFAGVDKFLSSKSKCINDYQMGAELYRKAHLGLLKARNMLKYAIENQLKNESEKVRADAHLYIALSYLAQDELYQILEVKKHAALWKELGGEKIEIFSKEKNKELNALLTYTAYNENTGVMELLEDGIDKGFLNVALSFGGVYNYLNDDVYMPLSIVKRDENKYAVNPFFTNFYNIESVLSAFSLMVYNDNGSDPLLYNVRNNYDNIYNNPVYILPLNGAVYIVEMQEDKPLKVEFLNPAYFDTSYGSNGYTGGDNLPAILNEYGFNVLQKDYIAYDNGKGKFIWNGNIKDQQPDKAKLFKLRNVMDCLHGNEERLLYFCSNRARLITAKYEYDNYKCRNNKKNCFISVDDMIKRGDFYE